jgi:O-antigen ligase
MLMAHSRTSIIGFVVSAVFLFAFGQKKMLGFGIAMIGSVIILAIPQFYKYAESYIVRGQTKDAFVTLSGRMNFWPDVMEAFWLSPAVGHGYYAGHRDLVVDGRKLLEYSSVDNTYLEVLVDLGILGLIIMSAAVISVGLKWIAASPGRQYKSIRGKWKPYWILLTGFFLIVFIRSLTGPTFQVYHPNLMLFLLLALCLHKVAIISKKESRLNSKKQVDK